MANKSNKTRQPYTLKGKEQELISLAMDQAERQLREGTAPASTVNYFLKLASDENRIRNEMIREQTALLQAKVENIKSSQDEVRIYQEAIDAIKNYGYGGKLN